MQAPNSKVGEESKAVETALRPAYPLVSNQPDRYGLLSEAFLFIEERRLYNLIARLKRIAIIIAIPLSVPIIWRLSQIDHLEGGFLDVAKILFIYILIGTSLLLLGVFIYRQKILQLLFELEELAEFGEDFARFYMPYAREELRALNAKLTRHKQDPTIPTSLELVKEFWPVIFMFFKKEQNLLRWGLAGVKALKSLSEFLEGKKQEKTT